tara:strand:+ start:6452 stop:6766 length:315 start_codon:yes stop_codon:yes gene_type:complete
MKTITIEITDLQWASLADMVEDPAIWARGAVMGKVDRCVENVVAKEQKRLLEDPNIGALPGNVEDTLKSYFSQPDYKTRAERERDKEAAMEAQLQQNLQGATSE